MVFYHRHRKNARVFLEFLNIFFEITKNRLKPQSIVLKRLGESQIMWERRTDLAAESVDLAKKQKKFSAEEEGILFHERLSEGFPIHEVEIRSDSGAKAIGKPKGHYVTMELGRLREQFSTAVEVLGEELNALLPASRKSILVIGLGNGELTADAIGPLAVGHILPTRHLKDFPFAASLSVHGAEVVGKSGIEAAEQAIALTRVLGAEAVILIDALAALSVERLCTTVQLSDSGLIPGSGVGNHRMALNEETLGVPVIALGVPTVVESAALVMDLLEEAGAPLPRRDTLRHGYFVTPKDIDAEVRQLSRLIGWSINAAVLGLSAEESAALLG